MKIYFTLGSILFGCLAFVSCFTASAEEYRTGSGQSTYYEEGDYCIVGVDGLYKRVSVSGRPLVTIPFTEATAEGSDCPRVRDVHGMRMLYQAHGLPTNATRGPASIPRTVSSTRLNVGCSELGHCESFNENLFDFSKVDRSGFNHNGRCDREHSCPTGMTSVCNETYFTKVCIDTELDTDASGIPRGNHTFHSCQSYCRSRGLRLPTNNEWLVAALGTNHRQCLPNSVTRRPDYNSRSEMTDLDFNRTGIRGDRSQCVSDYGVRDMVGVLGQWVTDGQARPGREQFNGGFWGQVHSRLFYRTRGHGPTYTDYSIGCRCAQ